MQVKIRSYFSFGQTAALKRFKDDRGFLIVEVEEGATVAKAIRHLPLTGAEGVSEDFYMFIFVNGRSESLGYVLKPGDVIDLHTPAMGG